MENNESTKKMFLDLIPRIQEMIHKEEAHILKMTLKKEEYISKQEEQNKTFLFNLFPGFKIDYTEMIEFLERAIERSEQSKNHFEMRLKEYQEYISKNL